MSALPVLMELAGEPIAVRPYSSADMPYVRSTWERCYRPRIVSHVSKRVFQEHHIEIIGRLLKGCVTIVACDPKVPESITAWACGAPGSTLHYAYVPLNLRGNGIARELIRHVLGGYPSRINVTHRFSPLELFKPPRFVFNPYLLGMTP